MVEVADHHWRATWCQKVAKSSGCGTPVRASEPAWRKAAIWVEKSSVRLW
jgi:hypothetical protein